ncbi:hypothetical protein SDC9_81665 [bioreactor metagenome]|uniref:Uncharacterized protein n=1 Tax=bioreactor metagenome TaxID=1076179 RepID=A0A644Z2E2_9ZZZZ
MALGAPRVARTLFLFSGWSCSGTTAKSKGAVPSTEGVMRVQHFCPVALARARVKGAAPLPAERKRVEFSPQFLAASSCLVLSKREDAPASSIHRAASAPSMEGRNRAFHLKRRARSHPVGRGTSSSTTSAPVKRESHPATPLPWKR